ncbi:hypothetical protein BAY61_29030 [Prauserella marina]|uniref:hypothetical protein n=1 Tax=Prauserella marina TaxID=530584 RepID=UPI000B84173E|nr:hypothetical protein [Prauserella marina]ASR38378.1 hypothetical protein BAY61_29030 [Prauserella marina]
MSGDGTQAPEPPLAFTDPVGGSPSGGRTDYGVRSGAGRDDDTGRFQIATPVAPDPEMVRSMVDAALGEDRPVDLGDSASVEKAAAAVEAGEAVEAPEPPPETAAETTGQLPAVPAGIPNSPGIYPQPHKAWTDRASWLPQVMRLRGKRAAKGGEGEGEDEDVAERPPSRPALRRPTSGSAGLAVALVLLAVFVLLAIQFVASFVESVTGLFN